MNTESNILRVGPTVLTEDRSLLSASVCLQRASFELLRLAAQDEGLLSADDAVAEDGVPSVAAADAVDRWLDRHIALPEPDESACRRHFAAHASRYALGEQVHIRHILFGVTAGMPVNALRERAEQVLIEVRANPTLFAGRARELSNCPSGAQGGDLGWLGSNDCVPELARELLGQSEDQAHVGVLPRLVHSRFGFHVIEVLAREPGQSVTFEQVQDAVRQHLQQQAWITAVRQQVQLLARRWPVEGADLEAPETDLMQ